jgi:hypothetical protein
MASAPSAPLKSPSTIRLALYLNRNLPTDSAEEPKIYGTNSISPLESTKVSKKQTQKTQNKLKTNWKNVPKMHQKAKTNWKCDPKRVRTGEDKVNSPLRLQPDSISTPG